MDNKLNSLLYRILKDRLRFSLGGLSFFIYEPSLEILQESYEVYDIAYEKAYGDNCYVKEELDFFLIDQNIWNPHMDKEVDELKKELENAKVDAYENFFKIKELRSAKFRIKRITSQMNELIFQKHSMDQLSCDGVAEQARFNWIISKTSFHTSGVPVNWSEYNLSKFINIYRENSIDHADIRKICRNDPWRSMWNISKKTGKLFDESAIYLSRDKLNLCSYSSMYDSVYESPDAPNEKVIEDDDCLDGWFISQRRKYEKSKKERESDDIIKNSKIKNSKEVFLMARDDKDAEQIMDLNDGLSKSILKQRLDTVKEKGRVNDLDFNDVQLDLQMQQHQTFMQKMKGRG